LPSQVPSRPQLEVSDSGQVLGRRGLSPAETKPQRPGELEVLQDLQVSVQALLQQTPSTQKPLAQSPLQPHMTPFGLRMPFVSLHATPSVAPSVPPSPLGVPPPLWQPAKVAVAATTIAATQALRRWRELPGWCRSESSPTRHHPV